MEAKKKEIERLKKERNAVILAHNYALAEVQDVADFVGDSLGLSIEASKTDADVIVFCGVTFMGETAKVVNPDKKVLMPEPEALCTMAAMCTAQQIREAKAANPDAVIVGYVNTTAESKAEMDVCCTSANAVGIVRDAGSDKIIFVPDGNLGNYVASMLPGKEIIRWHGFCPIHHSITAQQIGALREKHPKAEVLAHPECVLPVLEMADFVGSTEGMLEYSRKSGSKEFIIATEIGMAHRLEKECPGKKFIFPSSAVCSAMKMTDLDSIISCLENLSGEITVAPETSCKAKVPVERMIGGSV